MGGAEPPIATAFRANLDANCFLGALTDCWARAVCFVRAILTLKRKKVLFKNVIRVEIRHLSAYGAPVLFKHKQYKDAKNAASSKFS